MRHFHSHFNTANQIYILKQQYFQLFEFMRQIAEKLFFKPKLAKIEEQILQGMAFIC